jgi:hypothetical protein
LFDITVSPEALDKLKTLVGENGKDSFIRFREYKTGTPCSRKIVPGLTIDYQRSDEDLAGEVLGLTFVAESDFVDIYGKSFSIDLKEERLVVVGPES